jgi:deoxyribodipyrimidine photo-lyase
MSGIVWFRKDLRLEDNPALAAATANHESVTALFVIDRHLLKAGANRRNLLLAHLSELDRELQTHGGRLRVEEGDPVEVIKQVGGTAYWNADYSPYALARDNRVRSALVDSQVFHGSLIHHPGRVLKDNGEPYRVFTPYYKRWLKVDWTATPKGGDSKMNSEPGAGIPDGDPPLVTAGSAGARERLESFKKQVDNYQGLRDDPGGDATSHLSSDLKFGTISPRTVWDEIGTGTEGRRQFLRQLCWRDFHAQILYYFPHSARGALKTQYDAIEWLNDPSDIEAWKAGRTGYPLVDAAMRQLTTTGWMHNRTRMITASFLVKHLLVDWRIGERFFMEHLIDGDPAQNIGNWQWVAGTGSDAAPYFRVFNPIVQSKKFDSDGHYIRRYVPELASLANRDIHAPWDAAPLDLAAAGIELGVTYPTPVVDHQIARKRALNTYKQALT